MEKVNKVYFLKCMMGGCNGAKKQSRVSKAQKSECVKI